ncbi:MAG TPA: hypothetical protein DIT48_02835, partial [Actinobacteria bacterium]|nr:hypothetical protein [Actinomycetota bacterium]
GDPANAVTGCNYTQAAAFHSVWTAVSDDNGATWTDHLGFDPGPLHDASEIFADMALDNQGNPYLAFTMNLTNDQDPTARDRGPSNTRRRCSNSETCVSPWP